MNQLMRMAIRLCGSLWVLGWFALYLEIYRWLHVTPSLHLNGPPSAPGTAILSRPGGFLIAVLASSALAPLLFVSLLLWNRRRGPKEYGLRSQVAFSFMASGIAVSLLGAVNQLVHDPRGPLDFDLAMRHGNGGFILNGAALAALSFVVSRFRAPR